MVSFNNIKIVSLAFAASLPVLYLGFAADASSAFAKYVGRCATNLEFYEKHMRWCEAAYTVSGRKARQARREPAGAFPPVQTYGDQVTVYRDHQAGDDGHMNDKYVVLQTREDVARSPFFGLTLGWFPGAINLGTNTIAAPAQQVASAQRPRVVTTYYVKKVVASQ